MVPGSIPPLPPSPLNSSSTFLLFASLPRRYPTRLLYRQVPDSSSSRPQHPISPYLLYSSSVDVRETGNQPSSPRAQPALLLLLLFSPSLCPSSFCSNEPYVLFLQLRTSFQPPPLYPSSKTLQPPHPKPHHRSPLLGPLQIELVPFASSQETSTLINARRRRRCRREEGWNHREGCDRTL